MDKNPHILVYFFYYGSKIKESYVILKPISSFWLKLKTKKRLIKINIKKRYYQIPLLFTK